MDPVNSGGNQQPPQQAPAQQPQQTTYVPPVQPQQVPMQQQVPIQQQTPVYAPTQPQVAIPPMRPMSSSSNKELNLSRIKAGMWLIINLIGLLIGLRFIFYFLGANPSGFAQFIYTMSAPFVGPFQGIFPEVETGVSVFDTASILAVVAWYILGFILTYVISIFSNKPGTTN
ncbi:hypothetical protein HGA91_02715 [candidate division WWE3 bacterium]|nr:hypothetical protein [candidate division WWE3 bacterium]